MTVHAIGDRANYEVLDAYEQLRGYETENQLPHLRHRIEHVQVIHPDDAPPPGAAGCDRIHAAHPRHIRHADGRPVLG